MGKPKGKNAFFHYLIHTQNNMRRNGQNLGLNDPKLQEIAGNEWTNMSAEERKPFEIKSKNEKSRLSDTVLEIRPKNYNQRNGQQNYGRNMAEECDDLDNELGNDQYLDKIIRSCVKACKTTEDLVKADFFIVSNNIMVKTDDNQYIPMEIGICQYSIKDGIKFTYQCFVDPGPIPLGYARLANEFSNDYHRIPLINFLPATNDYRKIVEDIVQILDESRFTNEITNQPTKRMVFCLDDQKEQNKGVFRWLAHKYKKEVPNFDWDLEVLDLVNLVFHATNEVNQRVSYAVAEDKLTSSAFDYSANTNCNFHEEQDNKYCAQGLARRLCYMLSDIFCPIFGINPTENHFPPSRKNIIAETYSGTFHDYMPLPSYRFSSSTSNDDDWAPQPQQQRPESSASARPQSSLSQSSVRPGVGPSIGRGLGRGLGRGSNPRQ